MKLNTLLMSLLLVCSFTLQAKSISDKKKDKSRIFIVLDITVHDAVLYEQYRIKVEPILKKYGGKYLVRSGGINFESNPELKVIPVEGDWNPNRLIIVEWESMEQLQKFTGSEEYKKAAEMRAKAATTKSIIVKEYPNH